MGQAPYTAEYSLPPWLELLRPHNGLLAAVAVIIGSIVAAGPEGVQAEVLGVVIAGLAVFLFVGGGNALNDYYDAETDKVNHPDRPIPSGRLTEDEALWIGRGLLLVAVLLTLILGNPLPLLLIAAAAGAMVGYEVYLKERGFIGNITIAGLSGALFLFGGLAYPDSDTGGGVGATLVLAFLATVATLGREIIKDVQDASGDTDRQTLAHSLGESTAAGLAVAILFLGVIASFLPYQLGLFEGNGETYYLVTIVGTDLIFLAACERARTEPATASKLVKFGMFAALLAFLLGATFN